MANHVYKALELTGGRRPAATTRSALTERKLAALAALTACLLAVSAVGGAEETATAGIVVWMSVDIAADGHVIAATPREGTLPQLGSALSRRVLQFHYTPATWRGQPVAVRQWLSIGIVPVPTTTGGYALRIRGTGNEPNPESRITPPEFPREAMIAQTNATLVYRVHVAEDGAMLPMERLDPDVVKGHLKALDKVSREAIATSRTSPAIVDGVAVACETRYPLTFVTSRPMPPPDLEHMEPLANQCPKAKLETEIAGMML